MDLIDRQDAIRIVDSIDTWQAGWRGNAIESLKALPSVQPEPQQIPVTERLPEHSGWYIVTKKLTDDGDKAVCLSWYSFHGWEWGENPIAWMPLPLPYQGEGGQE